MIISHSGFDPQGKQKYFLNKNFRIIKSVLTLMPIGAGQAKRTKQTKQCWNHFIKRWFAKSKLTRHPCPCQALSPASLKNSSLKMDQPSILEWSLSRLRLERDWLRPNRLLQNLLLLPRLHRRHHHHHLQSGSQSVKFSTWTFGSHI